MLGRVPLLRNHSSVTSPTHPNASRLQRGWTRAYARPVQEIRRFSPRAQGRSRRAAASLVIPLQRPTIACPRHARSCDTLPWERFRRVASRKRSRLAIRLKIFWSWQSDTPGSTGRHIIRAALEAAIAELKVAEGIEEAIRSDLHLDSDRQGVPGSPDLARVILEKIDAAFVVIADVTTVGAIATDPDKRPKKLINSNVAIQFYMRYALWARKGSHGHESFLRWTSGTPL